MNKFTQLCVWPGTVVGQEKIAYFEKTMQEELQARVKYLAEVKTLPDIDENGRVVPGTGKRNDLFFFVHEDDIATFSIRRLPFGIRWWEDVNTSIYPVGFVQDHPKTW